MDASRATLRLAGSLFGLATVFVLSACGAEGGFPTTAGADPDPGYRAAPQLTGVARDDGGLTLRGKARAASRVMMVSAAGERVDTTAEGAGRFTARLGSVSEPALYRLAEEGDGQRVEAEGLVAVLPGGDPRAVLLRPGAGALAFDGGGSTVRVTAVDYDSGGAAVVSGLAPAGGPVRVLIDGQLAVEGLAGPNGRFSLTLPKPLAPGGRTLQVVTAKALAAASVTITAPAPPADAPYVASAQGGGWRIDWKTPGGGPQTTLLPGGAG
jgi:hypothetical protein